MLTGQNGILNKASEAKEKTEISSKDEQRKLAQAEALMSTGDTEYNGVTIPKGFAPTKIDGENSIDVGLVITDGSGNEYVWVEVPKTTEIYSTAGINITNFTDKEYAEIEKDLKTYTSEYSKSNFSDTNPKFITEYKNMLKSVYENEGFWIGRYEAGIDGEKPRISHTEITDKVVVKQDKIPYNYVTRDEAQSLAEKMENGECTSSLLFGIQWDLALKYIEEKTVETVEEANKDKVRTDIKRKLTSKSTTIGNYRNSAFILNRGKFAQYNALSKWYNFNSEEKPTLVTGSNKKEQSLYENGILLTTGATEATNLQNIYDIAGNVWEWTLEFYSTSLPCVIRGGSCYDSGSSYPAKNRISDNIGSYYDGIGFRVGLWK